MRISLFATFVYMTLKASKPYFRFNFIIYYLTNGSCRILKGNCSRFLCQHIDVISAETRPVFRNHVPQFENIEEYSIIRNANPTEWPIRLRSFHCKFSFGVVCLKSVPKSHIFICKSLAYRTIPPVNVQSTFTSRRLRPSGKKMSSTTTGSPDAHQWGLTLLSLAAASDALPVTLGGRNCYIVWANIWSPVHVLVLLSLHLVFFLEGEREGGRGKGLEKGERVRVMKFDVYKDGSVPTFIGDGFENLIFVVI